MTLPNAGIARTAKVPFARFVHLHPAITGMTDPVAFSSARVTRSRSSIPLALLRPP